ncbi:MAG: sodium-dependent transporter [Halieaceae bacterium]|nr:sodium-dependent transporter [Halieaceae bacterium]
MSIAVRSTTGVWGSRTTFVFALTASAIGLGNLWRFSYLLGEQGGAPFLVAYLVCLFLVAAPVLIAEILLGSHGRGNPVSALLYTARRSEISRGWVVIAWLAGIASILVLAYLSVVAGWGLAYIEKLQAGIFADASAADAGREFSEMLAGPRTLVQWQTIYIILVFVVSGLGIYRGLGPLFWLVGPVLLVSLGALIEFALVHGNMERAGNFLFSVNLYDFDATSILIAMGQAFYTLGIGLGVGMAFGAYAPDKIPLGRVVIAVALFDVLIALAAGIAIFPLVFATNLEPTMGPGLVFVGLPYAFGNMPQGELLGALFFLMTSMVALGSGVALAEPAMAWMTERMRIARPAAALLLGGAVWILALGASLSFNIWHDVYVIDDLNLFRFLEVLTTCVLLPLAALLTALLVGYRVRRDILRVELYRESKHFVFLWRACLRYIAPPVIVVIMLTALIEFL